MLASLPPQDRELGPQELEGEWLWQVEVGSLSSEEVPVF